MTIDAAAIWMPPAPAIIRHVASTETRFVVNDGKEWDCGRCLPRDFLAIPRWRRQEVPLEQVAGFLPEPFRRLGDDLLWTLLGANLPGLPGAIMGGLVNTAWLFTATGSFVVPSDWNVFDNAAHVVGHGGNGAAALESLLDPGHWYGGAGGGGAGYSGDANLAWAAGDSKTITIATDVWIGSATTLLAKGGTNGGVVTGGSSAGGIGGDAASGYGAVKTSGGTADTLSGNVAGNHAGGPGAGAGGPHGDGTVDAGDAGYGGGPGQDGTDRVNGGWNPNRPVNAGSGGGGDRGFGTPASVRDGQNGGKYGAGGGGSGGGSSGVPQIGTPGSGMQGCGLIVNNASA